MFSNRNIPLLFFLISIINGSFYLFAFDNIIFADASQYDLLAKNILKGHFSLSVESPYIPTMEREPLYSFFLSIIYKIFGYNYNAVYIIQILLFSFISLLTYYFAKNIFNQRTAIISASLVTLLPTLANYTGFIVSELFFTFVLICTLFILHISIKKNNKFLFFISGIALGLCVLTKAYMLFFILMILPYMIFRYFHEKINLLLNSLLLLLGFLLILSFWSIRNSNKFDTYQISGIGGLSLWMAADQIDNSSKTIFKNIVFNFSEYLGASFFPENSNKPNEVILSRANNYHERIAELESLGYSSINEIEKKMTNEAIKKIIENPLIYSLQRFMELQKMISFIYIPSLNQLDISYLIKNNITHNKYFQNLSYGNLILSLIKFPFKILSYIIFFTSIYSIFKLRNNFKSIYPLVAIIFYTNFIYSMLFGLGRYGVPLLPYYIILTSWILSELLKKKKT